MSVSVDQNYSIETISYSFEFEKYYTLPTSKRSVPRRRVLWPAAFQWAPQSVGGNNQKEKRTRPADKAGVYLYLGIPEAAADHGRPTVPKRTNVFTVGILCARILNVDITK